MLVTKCYTCGRFLGKFELPWIRKKEECENNNLSDEETLDEMAKFLDDNEITSRCCRKCLLATVEYVKIIS